jgi:hypothetical protein
MFHLLPTSGALALLAGASLGQDITSANDTCSSPFIGGDGSYSVDTTGATASGVMATGLPPYTLPGLPNTACQDFDGAPDDLHLDAWMQWTADESQPYEIGTCNLSGYDSKIAIYSNNCPAPTAIACNDDGVNCAGFSSRMQVTGIVMGTTYLIQVGGFDAAASGTATLTIAPNLACSAQPDDAFEPNDTCLTPSAITLGSYNDLFIGSSQAEDYYLVTGIPDGQILEVDASSDFTDGNIDLFIYDSGCALVDSSENGSTSNEAASASNQSGGPADYVVRVARIDASPGCNDYDLDLQSVLDPCINMDDALEENDDCASALPVPDSTHMNLFASLGDSDYYSVTVADGDTLTVNLTFAHLAGDIDGYIYDPLACGDTLIFLDRGFSASDNEILSWDNTTGMEQTYIVGVVIYEFTSGPECNNYGMTIMGAQPVEVGSNYCISSPNSVTPMGEFTGAIMSATGTTSVAANDLVVSCGPMGAFQPVIFFYGTTKLGPGGNGLPFGEGLRCTGGDVVRFFPPGFSDPAGFYELAIDNTANVVVTAPVPIADMATMHFQGWYRDPDGGGTGFNLSDARTVTFTP